MLDFLLFTLLIALGINLVGFFIAFYLKTDKLTDFSYALSFVAIALTALFKVEEIGTSKLIIVGLISLWALRLGSYLVIRIRAWGRDRRFDDIRNNFFKFFSFWLFQAITAWIVLLAPLLYIYDSSGETLGYLNIIGIGVFLFGLSLEALADLQLFDFTQNQKNKGKFISSGVWKISRHPNYLGEIITWFGAWVFTLGSFNAAITALAFISPLFIFVMLRFVSGVPKLEKNAAKKWGSDSDYQKYKNDTGLLFPKLP